jgi:hypothetical protein
MDNELEKIKNLKMHEEIAVGKGGFWNDEGTVRRVPGGLLYEKYTMGGLFSAGNYNRAFVPFTDFYNKNNSYASK